ncbi:MAG: nitrate/nitrite transporter NrtS [Flavobacteriaceae bacterium]
MFLKICKTIIEKDIVISSLKVALVVGIILNIINQGDVLFSMQFDKINWWKLLLTFAVPYLVSTYASVRERLK